MRALFLLAALLASMSVLAVPYGYDPTGGQRSGPSIEEPAQVLRQGIDALSGYVGGGTDDAARLRGFVEREIAPLFDFAYMGRWAAGPMGRRMSVQQQQQLTQVIQNQFLEAMVERLSNLSYSRINYLPPRGSQARGDVTLGLQIISPNAYPVQVDFRFHLTKRGWGIYDVVANGASALAFFRDQFASTSRGYGRRMN